MVTVVKKCCHHHNLHVVSPRFVDTRMILMLQPLWSSYDDVVTDQWMKSPISEFVRRFSINWIPPWWATYICPPWRDWISFRNEYIATVPPHIHTWRKQCHHCSFPSLCRSLVKQQRTTSCTLCVRIVHRSNFSFFLRFVTTHRSRATLSHPTPLLQHIDHIVIINIHANNFL